MQLAVINSTLATTDLPHLITFHLVTRSRMLTKQADQSINLVLCSAKHTSIIQRKVKQILPSTSFRMVPIALSEYVIQEEFGCLKKQLTSEASHAYQ